MIRKLLVFFVTSGLAATAWRRWRDGQQRQRAERGLEREAVQRWEDEGGAPITPQSPTPGTARP